MPLMSLPTEDRLSFIAVAFRSFVFPSSTGIPRMPDTMNRFSLECITFFDGFSEFAKQLVIPITRKPDSPDIIYLIR